MKASMARRLTRLYPRAWRTRYGAEFVAHLETGRSGVWSGLNVIASAAMEHLAPTAQSEEETGARSLRAWCVRTPWMLFGVAPGLLLAGAYFFACLLLWLGWRMFLPGHSTPFVPVHGVAAVYFGLGRAVYFGAPVLIGWGLAIAAIRHRLRAGWLAASLLLLAWIGSAVRVQATVSAAGGGAGNIGIGFDFFRGLAGGLPHAGMILLLTLPPYLLLRWRVARSRVA